MVSKQLPVGYYTTCLASASCLFSPGTEVWVVECFILDPFLERHTDTHTCCYIFKLEKVRSEICTLHFKWKVVKHVMVLSASALTGLPVVCEINKRIIMSYYFVLKCVNLQPFCLHISPSKLGSKCRFMYCWLAFFN